MVRKYEYIDDSIPSEDFTEGTFDDNKIADLDMFPMGYGIIRAVSGTEIRHTGVNNGSGFGAQYSGYVDWDTTPGLWAKIVDGGAPNPYTAAWKEMYRVTVTAYNSAWDIGDGGDTKSRLTPTPSLAASGDYVVFVRPAFDFLDLGEPGYGALGDGLHLSNYRMYREATLDQAAGYNIDDVWADNLSLGSVTYSNTQAFVGSYSYRMACSGSFPDPLGFSFHPFSWAATEGTKQKQSKTVYFSCYVYYEVDELGDPQLWIYLGYTDGWVCFGVDTHTSTSYYCYRNLNAGSWTPTTIPLEGEKWVKFECYVENGNKVVCKIDSQIVTEYEGAENGIFDINLFVERGAGGSGSNRFVYYDKLILQQIPNESPWFITPLMNPPHRVGRWESFTPTFFSSFVSDDYSVRVTAYDEDDNIVDPISGTLLTSGTEMSLTDIDEWFYQNLKFKVEFVWQNLLADRQPDGEEFVVKDWTVKYSRAPDAVSLMCEQNSGSTYNDISPRSSIRTETDALTAWRARYNERTHPVFDILFDWGDGHNTGWQSGEKYAHVYDRACEATYSDPYYPFFIAQDQYGGLSASGCALDLDVWSAADNLLKVLGDYSDYGQHKRIWARTGGARDNFYHIESSAFSAGTTTFTLDDHYDLDADGIVQNDRVDIIDCLLGDWDGQNDSYYALSYKVAPTAVLRGRPIVGVSGSTVVFDGSESFTPNDEEAVEEYTFDSDDSDISAGTSSMYSHVYDAAGMYNPTLKVKDTNVTGTYKESSSQSLTVTIMAAADYGTPAIADVYDLKTNLHNQPSEFSKMHEREFQETDALAGGYPDMIDTGKKVQEFNMKGTAKPLKFYSSATTTQKDAGELDLATLLTLWKNGTIFKYKYRETRLSGAVDEKWFVGRIETFNFTEVGGRPHHYEWTAQCHYIHGIAGSDQEV